MSMLRLNLHPFYSPDDNLGEGPQGELSKDGILDILNEDDVPGEDEEIDLAPKPKKEDVKEDKEEDVKEEEEEEEDELDELEDELDEDVDDLELVDLPRRQEILAKYPKIFKDFPGLEKAYFREREYSKLLPTVDDAKLAVEKSKTLDNFEERLLKGETSVILKAVKDENENAFNKMVDNYLPHLRQVDEKAYYHVIGNIGKGIIYQMVKEGRDSDNEALQNAAQIVNQFLFGTSKYVPPQNLAKDDKENKEDPKAKEIEERERQFQQRQFENARDGLQNKLDKAFSRYIEKSIDPKDLMPEYVKRKAAEDARNSLDTLLEKDTRFRAVLDKAWKSAMENNFDADSMARVQKVITSRSQSLLPAVIKKARNEALRGIGKRVKTEPEESDTNDTEEQDRPSSRNRGPLKEGNNNRGASKNKVPEGMSNRDFIMSD